MIYHLFFAAAFLECTLRLPEAGLIAVLIVCLSMLGADLLSGRKHERHAYVLGMVTPILPAFGSGSLLACAIFYLIFEGCTARRSLGAWSAPFLGVVSASILWQSVFGLDPKLLTVTWLGQDGPGDTGLANTMAWLRGAPPASLLAFESLARFAALAGLFRVFSLAPQQRHAARRGLIVGLAPALAVLGVQMSVRIGDLLPNQSAFWSFQGRLAGSFTDPNALGIFAVLVLPFLAHDLASAFGYSGSGKLGKAARRAGACLLLVAWLVVPLYSGSRSFFLGLAIYSALALWMRRPFYLLLTVLAGLALLALLNLAAVSAPGETAEMIANAPVGVRRLAESLQLSSLSKAFFSRTLFWRMGLEMFLDNPLSGVGFGRFGAWLPIYLAHSGVEIGNWVDNSNNFYLGLLAELGVFGLLGLAASLACLRPKHEGSERLPSLYALAALSILLVVGPHLDFDEVAVCAALVLSGAVEAQLPRRARIYAAGALVVAGLLLSLQRELRADNGLYAWERLDAHRYFRWSSRVAILAAHCGEGEGFEVGVRAASPDLSRDPVTVRLSGACGNASVELATPAITGLKVPCHCAGGRARYTLEVERVWTPRKYSRFSLDARLLGVQVYTGDPVDLLE